MRSSTVRFFALTMLISVLGIGSARTIGEHAPWLFDSPYRCLVYADDKGISGRIIDIHTGIDHRDSRPNAMRKLPVISSFLSPDEHYRADFVARYADGVSTLYLYPVEGSAVRVQDVTLSAVYTAAWSPDSKQLAYVHVDQANALILSLISADGNYLRHITVPTLDPRNTVIYAWSPDGHYVLLGTVQPNSKYRLELWDAETYIGRPLITHDWAPEAIVWSPDGRHLAYLYHSADIVDRSVAILALDTLVERNHRLDGLVFRTHKLQWSMSSQFVQITYEGRSDQPNPSNRLMWKLNVIGLDGSEYHLYPQEITVRMASVYYADHLAQFTTSADQGLDQLVYFWQAANQPDDFSLNRYTPVTGERCVLVSVLAALPIASPRQPDRVGVVERNGAQLTGVLMNRDGSQRVPIFHTGADDDGEFSNIEWASDNSYVVFTWVSGRDAQRDGHLAWSKPDGSELREMHGYHDFKPAAFSGDFAMFVAKPYNVGALVLLRLDLRTGALTTIGRPFTDVEFYTVDIDGQTGDYRVWWHDGHDVLNIDVYAVDPTQPRERHFRFGLPQVAMAGLPYILFAPDGQTAAGRFDTFEEGQFMQISRADGSEPHFVAISARAGEALWSPDGKLVAFTQEQYTNQLLPVPLPPSLEIYTANGDFVRSLDDGASYKNATWTTCA